MGWTINRRKIHFSIKRRFVSLYVLPLNFSIIALAFFLCRSKTGTITLDEMASKQNITMSANMSEQCDGTWSGVYIATSSLSFIINFLHLLILRAMPNLRKRNYFWILFGINMADMFSAIFYIISTRWKKTNFSGSYFYWAFYVYTALNVFNVQNVKAQ